ncbi:LysR substrate-binding domain-containing protein [Rhizobium puerariae]|uniref:LysR substrate-binding domain-containing protein n=1 Tax=Rhizobium puerariae TaxID=1585791 RepID=A0ABV6ARV4_9HYPH
MDSYIQKLGISPREWLELDSLEAIVVMVDAGLGVSVMPDWNSVIFEHLRVARLPLSGAPHREIGLIRPRRGAPVRLIRAILEALQK